MGEKKQHLPVAAPLGLDSPNTFGLESPSFWQHFLGWIAQTLLGWKAPAFGNTF